MEENEKIQIQVRPDQDGHVTILHGEAKKQINAIKASFKGTIDAPSKYFAGISSKRETITDTAVVTIDSVAGRIVLQEDPHHPLAGEVTGSVVENPQLKLFRINSEKRWTPDELAATVFQNANVFNVPVNEVRAFAAKFRNLKAKVEKEVENMKDDKGNVVDNFVQTVKVEDLPTLPFYTMPYIGSDKVEFKVEVGIEAAAKSVVFYLFSAEYANILYQTKEDLLYAEAKKFADAGVCVIEVV